MSELNKLDVLAEEKRARSLLKSAEGRQALRNVTGFNFVFNGEIQNSNEPLPIVALLQPSYDRPRRGVAGSFDALYNYSRKHCAIHVPPSGSTSITHWTRNMMWSDLIKSGQPWDYVLWWDDDITVPPDALVKLLNYKVDIVAAGCTVRTDPPMPNFLVFDPVLRNYKKAFDYQEFQKIDSVGTGFMLISNKASLRIAEYYLNCEYEKKYYGLSGEMLEHLQNGRQTTAKTTQNCWWFENLKQPDGHGEFGEDISFCFKAMECGIPVHLDTTIRPRHHGDYGFSLDDFEKYREDKVRNQVLIGERITSEAVAMLEAVN